MNLIQFSNGVFGENGNVQNRVHAPLPSFNPTPDQLPGIGKEEPPIPPTPIVATVPTPTPMPVTPVPLPAVPVPPVAVDTETDKASTDAPAESAAKA